MSVPVKHVHHTLKFGRSMHEFFPVDFFRKHISKPLERSNVFSIQTLIQREVFIEKQFS